MVLEICWLSQWRRLARLLSLYNTLLHTYGVWSTIARTMLFSVGSS
jgi:hypothetical protein